MNEYGANMTYSVQEKDNKIFSHIRKMWLIKTPEEIVRQNYLLTLVNEYSYSLDQIDEELTIAGRGAGKARADFVIWKSVEDKQKSKAPLIIVECKSDNITISHKAKTILELLTRHFSLPIIVKKLSIGE